MYFIGIYISYIDIDAYILIENRMKQSSNIFGSNNAERNSIIFMKSNIDGT